MFQHMKRIVFPRVFLGRYQLFSHRTLAKLALLPSLLNGVALLRNVINDRQILGKVMI